MAQALGTSASTLSLLNAAQKSSNNSGVSRDPNAVREMFGRIARRYDLANHLLSGGADFLWRRRAAKIVQGWRPRWVLDLATGSGDLALAIQRRLPEATITAADFSPEMLSVAQRKGVRETVLADATQLPFEDESFDCVTVAFGLDYQVPDVQALTSLDDAIGERRAQPVVADQAAVGDGKASDAQKPPEPEPPPVPAWVEALNDSPVPAWVEAWNDSRVNVVILAVLLSVLTVIFVFQATLARFRLAHRLVRNGFLLVVLVWLGWTAGVQLSIVNVMNYLRAPFLNLDVGVYLAEPLMVIIDERFRCSFRLAGFGHILTSSVQTV